MKPYGKDKMDDEATEAKINVPLLGGMGGGWIM